MLNLKDQAEGLRTLLGNRGNKNFIVLSALDPIDRNTILLNISVAIINNGESVQFIDANRNTDGVSSIAKNKQTNSTTKISNYLSAVTPSLKGVSNGIGITKIFNTPETSNIGSRSVKEALNLIEESTGKSTISFIDIDVNDEITEYLDEITGGQVIVLVNNQENSIKKAYTLLKKLSSKISDLKVNILVNGCNKKESQIIQRNISLTASNYLSISTTPLGNIIHDEGLVQANKIGRSVFETAPESKSVDHFREIASNILKESAIARGSKVKLSGNHHSIEVQ
uniref:MinD/ParA family ATP-binding protein n=1 Tax=Polynucleobacter sp. TaxID=2029855 RepID=UPI004047DEE3